MKPTIHRYIIELDPREVNVGSAHLLALAGVPFGRIPFASVATTNPLSGLERIEFRLFVDENQRKHESKP